MIAHNRLKKMSNSEILSIWNAINAVSDEIQSDVDDVSFEEWINLVYSEKSIRGL